MTTRTDIRTTEETKRRDIGMMSDTEITALVDALIPDVNSRRVTEARTATADGTGTGTITDGTDVVIVTSADANNIIVLPDATIGDVIMLANGATGYELRTHSPTTVGINGGTGADAESAIAASTVVWAQRVSATNWIAWSRVAAGTLSVVQVAA